MQNDPIELSRLLKTVKVEDQILLSQPFKQVLSRTSLKQIKWTDGVQTKNKMWTEFKSVSVKLALGL